jgi:PAS domain S-box-containing protein
MNDHKLTYEELMAQNEGLRTRIKELESKLIPDATHLLKLLMNSLPIIIAYIDKDLRYKLANNHFQTLHGIDPDEMIGKTVQEVIGDDGWEIEKEKYFKALKGEKVVSVDKFTTKVGLFHWYQVTLIPHIEKGIVKGIFGLVVDLTDQKVMENKLLENEKSLTRTNATKDKFFSIIAHDLRSPISHLVGLSNLIDTSIQEKQYESVEEYRRLMHKASEETLDLINNLFEWSRSQRKEISFNPEMIDFPALVKHSIDLMMLAAEEKQITITADISDEVQLSADKEMIKTILRNLIFNAIKFTPKNGKIIVALTDMPNECLIRVIDNGVGISEDKVKKLFKISESISTNGTEKERGTGLGLILCDEFVKKHGGEISVKSEVSSGSIFEVKLPKFQNEIQQ